MKTRTLVAAVLLTLAGLSVVPAESKAQQVSMNFSVFHSELSHYGRWVESPRFGQVWIYNEPGFRPYYTNGHWDYTDYGWAWVSNYDWGWAPFHYGRWEYDLSYGWMWIPGYEWAPAWVSWSENGDYYGWAPMGHGWNVNISLGSIPYDRWVFVSRPYMNSPRFRDYCAPIGHNRVIIRNTTIINNVYTHNNMRYYSGPGRYDVERYSRGPVNPRQIDNDRAFRNRNWGYSDDRFGQNRRSPAPGTPDRPDRGYKDRRADDARNMPDRDLRREYPDNGRIARDRRMRDMGANGSQGHRDQPAGPAQAERPGRTYEQRPNRQQGGGFEQRESQRRPVEIDQRRVDRRQNRGDIGQQRFENPNSNGNNPKRANSNGNGRERGNRNGRGAQQPGGPQQ